MGRPSLVSFINGCFVHPLVWILYSVSSISSCFSHLLVWVVLHWSHPSIVISYIVWHVFLHLSASIPWNKEQRNSLLTTTTMNYSCKTRNEDQLLASAVQFKLKAGNFKAALPILFSDDGISPTEQHHTSRKPLQQKREISPRSMNTNLSDRQHKMYTVADHPRRRHKTFRTFPLGSSGGLDSLMPQHIIDSLTRRGQWI